MDLLIRKKNGECEIVTEDIESYDLEKRLPAMQVILDIVNTVKRMRKEITCPRCHNDEHFIEEHSDYGGTVYSCQGCGKEIHVGA
jgi:hypothetical protein